MAEKLVKTGYGGGAANFPIKLYVTYSYTQNVANNQSTITCGMYVTTPDASRDIGPWTDFNGSYVGTPSLTFNGSIPNFYGKRTLVSGKQFTVTHDASGKATATIYWQWGVNASWGGYGSGTNEGSFTITLPDIPRQAKILTAPNFTDEDDPTITYSNPAGNNVTSLQACIAWRSGAVAIPYRHILKTGSSYTFYFTDEERATLRNALTTSNSMAVNFVVKTVINGTEYLSTLEKTFSITGANPIVNGSVSDSNATTFALTGDSSKLIKYYSIATAVMTATAQKGAAINNDMCIIRNGSNTGYGKVWSFSNVESNVFTFSAEDDRGNIGTDTVTLSMIEYVKLTCNISQNRPDGAGNMTVSCSGNYFNKSFGAVSNTLQVQYRYKTSGSSYGDWIDMSATTTGNTYYASASLEGLDYEQTYSFETRAIDKLSTVTSKESTVHSKPIFHWGKNDFVFEVPVTFNAGTNGGGAGVGNEVEGDLAITGDLRLKGSDNYGNTLRFGDADYCYIKEASDDVMTIKATRINLDANGVYVDGYAIPILDKGVWTPSLFSSAISSYTTQQGWYMKMNQYVTVGFFIKATCKSGYQNTTISITGLPFTPLFSAVGGGMCSGAYVSGNNNFQCFVVQTSGEITLRSQACNNTIPTNLATSASGCYYSNGGGEITLGGTICYMANS